MDTMTNDAKPLWTDERIHTALGATSDALIDYAESFNVNLKAAIDTCKWMRDDMQQELARLQAAKEFQDAELADKQIYIIELEREVSRLRAATRWQPLPNGDYADVLIHNDQLSIVFWDNFGHNQTDTYLADNIRLCRRVEEGE